ncbi:hypothetical protein [Sphingobacterium sp. LRF_L2]|uniref:hypothetical protein n=1 Tax=Sphingobacterium sp. LRF_L2 TaxID=3369421 RepID=UPI003F5F123A
MRKLRKGESYALLKEFLLKLIFKSKNNRSRTLFSFGVCFVLLFSNQLTAQEPRRDSGADGFSGGQTTILKAAVRSAATDLPIEGARIRIDGLSSWIFTDKEGIFEISTPKSKGNLIISFDQYDPLELSFENGMLSNGRSVFYLARNTSVIRPLYLGDSIPESLWDMPLRVVNHSGGRSTVTLREYSQTKLIVLDFWTVYCSPCIRTVSRWESVMEHRAAGEIAYLTVYVDFEDRALPFIKNRGWRSTAIVGEVHRLLNAYFFREFQLGAVVFIRDGKFFAVPKNKGYREAELTALLDGEDVEYESDLSFAHIRNAVGEGVDND